MFHVQRSRSLWPAAVLAALFLLAGIVLAGRLLAQDNPASPTTITASAAAVGSGFAYQGRVADDEGNPIDGACDLRFGLYDAATGSGKVGEVTSPNHPVADGLFAVSLDFGAAAFRGDARWLEIAVRCPAGSGDYRTLDGRQPVSVVPYAVGLRPGAQIIGSLSGGVALLGVINNNPNFPVALFGQTTATSGEAIGVAGNNSSPDGFAVHGYSIPDGTGVRGAAGSGRGVWGSSSGSSGVFGETTGLPNAGVEGRNTTGGAGPGVIGVSSNGSGVWGHSENWVGTFGFSENNRGVYGETGSTWAAVEGRNTGSGPGIFGFSESGPAAIFDGMTRTDILEIVGGSDLAERFQVSGGVTAEPGTLMVIDPDNPGHLTPATTAYDRKVAGVVSGAGDVKTGLVLHQEGVLEGDTVVAIAGRVYVRAEALSGPIAPGDMLTTSNLPGHAMAAADFDRAQGAVIGKAMTGLESGTGLVLVLINLQ